MGEIFKVMGIMALMFLVHVFLTKRRYKSYYKKANQGTRCQFFIDQDRFCGWITGRDGDTITIHHMGKKYSRHITETYPV